SSQYRCRDALYSPSCHVSHLSINHFLGFLPLFFFLMTRRPPRSTLFPTRRSSDLLVWEALDDLSAPIPAAGSAAPATLHKRQARSEEHTSELQSQSNLVCRLLLEKKNKTTLHSGL